MEPTNQSETNFIEWLPLLLAIVFSLTLLLSAGILPVA